jgi:hypothetical protein
MTLPAPEEAWERQRREWRHPAEALSFWREAGQTEPGLLEGKAFGAWWAILEKLRITLLVTREYEHLLQAFSTPGGRPLVSHLRLPHPSGLAVKHASGTVYAASTRNPNQIFELSPTPGPGHPLLPRRSWIYPGCTYLHDLALVGGKLHANAVGQNAVLRLEENGRWKRVWWPRCLDGRSDAFDANFLQLNSIAAGPDLRRSFFSASVPAPGRRRPGQKNFAVDGRGVIFSGRTREPLVGGLTRPHSARLFKGELWVDNSGYGTVGVAGSTGYEVRQTLPGWTRGLAFCEGIVFVGTSRILPRFHRYAPGLRPERCVCGIHALERKTGKILGSYRWPQGNQIFAIEWLPSSVTCGFPFQGTGKIAFNRAARLFYSHLV